MTNNPDKLGNNDSSMLGIPINPMDPDVIGEILGIRNVFANNTLLVLDDDAGIFIDKIVEFFGCRDIDELVQKFSPFKTFCELDNFINVLNTKILPEVDPSLSVHHIGVSRLAEQISIRALEAGIIDKDRFISARSGAMLHDIGKLAIPNDISRPDKIHTDEQTGKMHEHPLKGYSLAKMLGLPKAICNAILFHHERNDGKGYPLGITKVPLAAQIVGLADMMWSMLEDRPYRNGGGPSTKNFIIGELRTAKERNQFDPRLIDIGLEIAELWLDNPAIMVPPAKDGPK